MRVPRPPNFKDTEEADLLLARIGLAPLLPPLLDGLLLPPSKACWVGELLGESIGERGEIGVVGEGGGAKADQGESAVAPSWNTSSMVLESNPANWAEPGWARVASGEKFHGAELGPVESSTDGNWYQPDGPGP